MKTFKLILNEKQYNVNVIGQLDTYGENDKTHFSEIPLIEFREGYNKSKTYDIRSVLNLDSESIISLDNTPLSLEDIKQIQNKLFEIFPPNYLSRFASLPKPKSKLKF
jgi:hypothetical protein